MSELLASFVRLAAVPARFGLLVAEAALSFGKSVVGSESASPDAGTSGVSDQEIDAAAGVIRASLLTGQDINFHDMLQTKFPEATIRAMAEAALLAARNARISAATRTRSWH